MLLKIYIIRHGQTEWSLTGQHNGTTDIPLTEQGEAEARDLSQRLRGIAFTHVLTSPLQRAMRTCELAALKPTPKIEADLAEWNYGDYESLKSTDINKTEADWNIFLDGGPNGETPTQISDRADRLITRLCTLKGNVALFSHGHFGRVLAARWIGFPVSEGQYFQLSTASISILSYDPQHLETPVIALWNGNSPDSFNSEKKRDIERWENEGGSCDKKQAD